MLTQLQIHLTKVFMKIFLRDRQSIIFSLLFPIIFMTVFGLAGGGDPEPIKLGIANLSDSPVAAELVGMLSENSLFHVTTGSEESLRQEVINGDQTLLLVVPPQLSEVGNETQLGLVVDAAQVQQLSMIVPVLEQTLLAIERDFRNIEPMFSLMIEDVQARSQRYIDFLLPGLLALTLMQLSIAGSGFNIVEFRRKGILKRLFVTPIQPRDFILAIVLARLSIVLMQLTVLMIFAYFALSVSIVGNFLSLYLVIILGTFIFLNLGFCLGSFAKTQNAVMAVGNLVIFPQIFLSGIFYPIESMPGWLQPIAHFLPLSFVSTAMREIANNGATLLEVLPSLFGIGVWLVIGFLLATRYFVWKDVAS